MLPLAGRQRRAGHRWSLTPEQELRLLLSSQQNRQRRRAPDLSASQTPPRRRNLLLPIIRTRARGAGSNFPRPGRWPAEFTARPGCAGPRNRACACSTVEAYTPRRARTLPICRRSEAGVRGVAALRRLRPRDLHPGRGRRGLAPPLAPAGFAATGPTSTCAIH